MSGVQEQVAEIIDEALDEALDEAGLTEAQVAEALEKADLLMPPAVLDEVMASQLQQHLQNYHVLVMEQRAARQTSDHPKAEKIRAALNFERTAAALIQYRFPNTKAMADHVMQLEAAQVRKGRAEASNHK